MTCYVKIENGVVVQKQPYFEEGFIEAPEWVVCGMLFDGTNYTNPPVVVPPPQPYTLPVAIFWLRMTDEEAEAFDGAVGTASPLRLRRAFNTATSIHSEGELFGFVRNVLIGIISAARVDQIMADPGNTASAVFAPLIED